MCKTFLKKCLKIMYWIGTRMESKTTLCMDCFFFLSKIVTIFCLKILTVIYWFNTALHHFECVWSGKWVDVECILALRLCTVDWSLTIMMIDDWLIEKEGLYGFTGCNNGCEIYQLNLNLFAWILNPYKLTHLHKFTNFIPRGGDLFRRQKSY